MASRRTGRASRVCSRVSPGILRTWVGVGLLLSPSSVLHAAGKGRACGSQAIATDTHQLPQGHGVTHPFNKPYLVQRGTLADLRNVGKLCRLRKEEGQPSSSKEGRSPTS